MNDLIRPEALHARQQAEQPVTIIDVRGDDEYAAGHIPGARHIPADEISQRLAEIPRGRPVVTY
jgi:rhodanese-related sulfurtransferase